MTATKTDQQGVRIDKWLWAARFFKTRGQAQQAVRGGRIEVNGQAIKPARPLRIGDQLIIGKGELKYEVTVLGLSERRLSAPQAQALYEESAASQARRHQQIETRRLERAGAVEPKRRPEGRQRRQLRDLQRRSGLDD